MMSPTGIEHILKRADQAVQLSSANTNAFGVVTLDANGKEELRLALQTLNAYAESRRGYGLAHNFGM